MLKKHNSKAKHATCNMRLCEKSHLLTIATVLKNTERHLVVSALMQYKKLYLFVIINACAVSTLTTSWLWLWLLIFVCTPSVFCSSSVCLWAFMSGIDTGSCLWSTWAITTPVRYLIISSAAAYTPWPVLCLTLSSNTINPLNPAPASVSAFGSSKNHNRFYDFVQHI